MYSISICFESKSKVKPIEFALQSTKITQPLFIFTYLTTTIKWNMFSENDLTSEMSQKFWKIVKDKNSLILCYLNACACRHNN